jgi:hypothetical protein
VFTNNGSGIYGKKQNLDQQLTYAVALFDIDNDDDLDIIQSDNTPGSCDVWINNSGNFVKDPGRSFGNNSSALAFGDFDRDGDNEQWFRLFWVQAECRCYLN